MPEFIGNPDLISFRSIATMLRGLTVQLHPNVDLDKIDWLKTAVMERQKAILQAKLRWASAVSAQEVAQTIFDRFLDGRCSLIAGPGAR